MSAFDWCLQLRHLKTAWVTRLLASTCPQFEQRWLVCWAGTGTNCRPCQSVLYSRFRRSRYQPCARIERFNPDFCLTFFPGCSTVAFRKFRYCVSRASSCVQRESAVGRVVLRLLTVRVSGGTPRLMFPALAWVLTPLFRIYSNLPNLIYAQGGEKETNPLTLHRPPPA